MSLIANRDTFHSPGTLLYDSRAMIVLFEMIRATWRSTVNFGNLSSVKGPFAGLVGDRHIKLCGRTFISRTVAKILVSEKPKKVKTLFPKSSGKQVPEKSVQKTFEHLKNSVQICSCPYVAVAQSLQILKEKRLKNLYRISRKSQHGYGTYCLVEVAVHDHTT